MKKLRVKKTKRFPFGVEGCWFFFKKKMNARSVQRSSQHLLKNEVYIPMIIAYSIAIVYALIGIHHHLDFYSPLHWMFKV